MNFARPTTYCSDASAHIVKAVGPLLQQLTAFVRGDELASV
jgi:hypothetical protein